MSQEDGRLYSGPVVARDYEFWCKTMLRDIEHHGYQETLNCLLMLGTVAQLGGHKS